MFSQSIRPSKEVLAPNAFHRISEIMEEVRVRFAEAAASGKATTSALPHRKKLYRIENTSGLAQLAPVNIDLPRLTGNISARRSTGMTIDECSKVRWSLVLSIWWKVKIWLSGVLRLF